jgi:predicted SnoaL-like aldol condensation-catalyzing enzyme
MVSPKSAALAVTLGLVFSAAAPALARHETGSAASAEERRELENKRVVIDFYNKAINEKDYPAASAYLGDRYIQHNPTAVSGSEGLKGFIEFLRAKFPKQHNEIKRVFADGDFVILHVHSVQEPGTLGRAIVDIFRLERGKVVEHWDVIQEVPAPSVAKNSNGMF